jgi:hypothetical protein
MFWNKVVGWKCFIDCLKGLAKYEVLAALSLQPCDSCHVTLCHAVQQPKRYCFLGHWTPKDEDTIRNHSPQQTESLRDLPGHRHGKLFIGRPCKKRADDLLRLSRPQLKMVVAILTGHAPVRRHLNIMDLFDGDPTCRFCRMKTETVQHIICCCKALVRQRYYVFGRLIAEPKYISTASVRDLCLFIRGTGLLNLC